MLLLSAEVTLVEPFLFSADRIYNLATNGAEWTIGFEVSWSSAHLGRRWQRREFLMVLHLTRCCES